MTDPAIQAPVGLTTEGLLARRYAALCIDSMLLACFFLFATRLAGTGMPIRPGGSPSDLPGFLLALVLWIVYGSALESSSWQATIGKRLMRLRVYDERGGRLGLLQAAGRNLIKDGPFLVLQLLPGRSVLSVVVLGAHVVALHRSPVYQAIHDRVAHSWVAAPEETTQLRLAQTTNTGRTDRPRKD